MMYTSSSSPSSLAWDWHCRNIGGVVVMMYIYVEKYNSSSLFGCQLIKIVYVCVCVFAAVIFPQIGKQQADGCEVGLRGRRR